MHPFSRNDAAGDRPATTGPRSREPGTQPARRRFLLQLARLASLSLGLLAGSLPASRRAQAQDTPRPARAAQEKILESAEFAYISPLRRSGQESTCHAELWYAWLDDSVVVIVSKNGWKARAQAQGLNRARIWIGNHGLWKGWFGSRNEAFRKAPSFVCEAERIRDDKLLARLLARYETKYPAEIADWRERMKSGYADGSRVLLRYRPTHPLA